MFDPLKFHGSTNFGHCGIWKWIVYWRLLWDERQLSFGSRHKRDKMSGVFSSCTCSVSCGLPDQSLHCNARPTVTVWPSIAYNSRTHFERQTTQPQHQPKILLVSFVNIISQIRSDTSSVAFCLRIRLLLLRSSRSTVAACRRRGVWMYRCENQFIRCTKNKSTFHIV